MIKLRDGGDNMKSRSELRESIMIILYQIEIYLKNKIAYDIDEVIKENVKIDNEFIKMIVYGVVTHKDEIDNIADKLLNDWQISRLDYNGSSILRMAIYEIKYTDTPDVVAINEAVELAKKYCDESIYKIINAVLDRLINE